MLVPWQHILCFFLLPYFPLPIILVDTGSSWFHGSLESCLIELLFATSLMGLFFIPMMASFTCIDTYSDLYLRVNNCHRQNTHTTSRSFIYMISYRVSREQATHGHVCQPFVPLFMRPPKCVCVGDNCFNSWKANATLCQTPCIKAESLCSHVECFNSNLFWWCSEDKCQKMSFFILSLGNMSLYLNILTGELTVQLPGKHLRPKPVLNKTIHCVFVVSVVSILKGKRTWITM